MNHRKAETVDHSGERSGCLDDRSPCRLFYVSKEVAIRFLISAAIIFCGSAGGVVWKASAYAAKVDALSSEVSALKISQENFQSQIVSMLADIKRDSHDNNRILSQGKWQWRTQP